MERLADLKSTFPPPSGLGLVTQELAGLFRGISVETANHRLWLLQAEGLGLRGRGPPEKHATQLCTDFRREFYLPVLFKSYYKPGKPLAPLTQVPWEPKC